MLWISLRMFEERRNLLTSLMKTEKRGVVKSSHASRLEDTEGYIERIRTMLLTPESGDPRGGDAD